MSSNILFRKVISNFPPVFNLNLYPDGNDEFQLIGWKDHKIYITHLMKNCLEGRLDDIPPCTYEEFTSTGLVVNVFFHESNIFVIDSDGRLYSLKKESLHDSDSDLFDDDSSRKNDLTFYLKLMKQLVYHCDVLSSCTVPDGLLLLIQEKHQIFLKCFSMKTFQIIKEGCIYQYDVRDFRKHADCHLLFIPEEDISVDFARHWFLKDTDTSKGIIITAIPETIVAAVSYASNIFQPYFFYSNELKAIRMIMQNDSSGISEDIAILKKRLVIVFQSGNISALTAYGKQDFYYPMHNAKNVFIGANNILCTDYSDSYNSQLSNNCEGFLLPIKGIVGFCSIVNSNNVLVSTKHGVLYNLNLKYELGETSFKMPEISLFDDIMRGTEYLEELTKKDEELEKYFSSSCLASSYKYCDFNLAATVISISGDEHTIRVVISSKTPKFNISSKAWHLAVQLESHESSYSLVRDLPTDFTSQSPLTMFFSFTLTGSDRDLAMSASFISFVSGGKHRPSINVGNFQLDISFFLMPYSMADFYKLNIKTKSFDLNNFLETLQKSNSREKVSTKDMSHLFEMSLDVQIDDSFPFFQKLMTNSRALWRNRDWAGICDKQELDLMVGSNRIWIQRKKSLIKICSNNKHLCYQMKYVVFKILEVTVQFNGDERMLMETENMLKSLEILQLKIIEAKETSNCLRNIFERKTTEITDKLLDINPNTSNTNEKMDCET